MISAEYLAGFFDGEGYVGIISSGRNYYKLHLAISNTNEFILQYIKAEYGGRFHRVTRTIPNHKPVYQLVWSGENAKDLIRIILPYSKVKSNQLQMALQFPIRRNISGIKTTRDPNARTKQVELFTYLKKLNHRGVTQ